ncbi:MAG: hypothetical protein KDD25_03445 [Bdellovibrionales bacterium]|nr:hypothetical protein [Bdellovibrionales bacterium]
MSAYKMWHNTWTESYKYFGWDPKTVHSDQWTRQDFVGILSYDGRPVGTCFFKVHRLDLPYIKDDSYFRMWPEAVMDGLEKRCDSNSALVCSWFTLNKEWRKGVNGIDAKYLLCSMVVKVLQDSTQSNLLCTVVKMSNMDKLVYELGASPIVKDVDEKGVVVDLGIWKKKEIVNFKFPRMHETVEQVYSTAYQGDFVFNDAKEAA